MRIETEQSAMLNHEIATLRGKLANAERSLAAAQTAREAAERALLLYCRNSDCPECDFTSSQGHHARCTIGKAIVAARQPAAVCPGCNQPDPADNHTCTVAHPAPETDLADVQRIAEEAREQVRSNAAMRPAAEGGGRKMASNDEIDRRVARM